MERKEAICFGEVLWDNLPTGTNIGGAPLNVAYHLAKNNIHVNLISKVGDDYLGENLLKKLIEMEISTRFCPISSNFPTSEVNVIIDTDQNISYHIQENVAWDCINFSADVLHNIKKADVFIYGTLSSRTSTSKSTLEKYLSISKWNVLDLNLREPFYTEDILDCLISYAHTLKVNYDELIILNNLFFKIAEFEIEQIMSSLFSKYSKLIEILITDGAKGAYFYNRNENYRSDSLQVSLQDTVGCGDAFLAGFVIGKLSNYSIENCMHQAILLSAFVATKTGGCPEYEKEELKKFRDELLS